MFIWSTTQWKRRLCNLTVMKCDWGSVNWANMAQSYRAFGWSLRSDSAEFSFMDSCMEGPISSILCLESSLLKSGCPGNTSAPNTDWFLGIFSQNFVTDDWKSRTKEWSCSLWSQSACPQNNLETTLAWVQQRKNSQICCCCCYVDSSSSKVAGTEGNATVGSSVQKQSRYSGLTLTSFPCLLLQPELLLSRSLWLPPALLWCVRHKMCLEGGMDTQVFILCNKSRKTVEILIIRQWTFGDILD